ncbi:MAG: diaminopimelate epimerase [Austwickia sp.]|nr:diaminopimelate epimerase [Austwickia sp.]MBK8435038.1 diaminopimelate epimerase [Austwickia sp.]MBK9101407.1 diaminopimelate epimerase [Austwickia sp.]
MNTATPAPVHVPGLDPVGGSEELELPFAKGHGTENDFVLVPDLGGHHPLSSAHVRFLADRRAGIGGDGVIRVAPTQASVEPEVQAQAAQARWFMDYRNADGSTAQMCGNGVRVFARYLVAHDLETGPEFSVATRAGLKAVRVDGEEITVGMGPWSRFGAPGLPPGGYDVLVAVPGVDPLPAMTLDLGNPHAVVALPESVPLDGLDLSRAPLLNPEPPDGINIEFVETVAEGQLRMRVFERGVGETRSCGTGACAAVLAVLIWSGDVSTPLHTTHTWQVDVPGGRLKVRPREDHTVDLAGPAVIVGEGTVRVPSWCDNLTGV